VALLLLCEPMRNHTATLALLVSLCAGGWGCSSADIREPVAPTIIDDDGPTADGDWKIQRSDYEAVAKQGIQHVMRWYHVRPHYKGGRFIGYEVAEIYKEELKAGPLRKGDVLLAVNDLPIERPEHAMAVWRNLWGQKSLKLSLLRSGLPTVLDIPVVESP